MLKALLALLLLAHAAWSQFLPTWQDQIYGAVQVQWTTGSWLTLSILAMLLSLMLVSLAYMAAKFFGSRELIMWAKAEFLQVIASAGLVLLFLVLTQVLIFVLSQMSYNMANAMNIDFSLSGSPPPPFAAQMKSSPFALAHYYIDIQLSCSKDAYRTIFWANLALEPIEKAVFPTGGMEEVTGWAFSGIVGPFYWIAHNLDFLFIANYFQRHLLIFIEDNMLTVFLPIGIVLRILPYTRGAGGVLMAISLGLFLIYPLMYAILLGVLPRTSSCTKAMPTVYSCQSTDPACSARIISYLNERNVFVDWVKFVTGIFDNLHLLFIASIVFPIINLTFTLTFIRSILQFLGADVAEMGQGIIKII